MNWQKRRDGLSKREFLKRYKVGVGITLIVLCGLLSADISDRLNGCRWAQVTKSMFEDICEQLRHRLEPGPHVTDPISTELALSMTLRYLAGGHVLDIVDLHGVAEPTFYSKFLQVAMAVWHQLDAEKPS